MNEGADVEGTNSVFETFIEPKGLAEALLVGGYIGCGMGYWAGGLIGCYTFGVTKG